MKKKTAKRLTAIVLSIFIIMTILPFAAFANDKTINEINVTVKKPTLDAAYSEENPDYVPKLDDCGLEIVNRSWLKLEDEEGIFAGSAEFDKFTGGNTYFALIIFKVKEGYKLPKDLSKAKVTMNFTNAEKETPKYVPQNSYKYEDGTYTIEVDDAGTELYGSIMYTVELKLNDTGKLNIKAKASVSDADYSKKGELLPAYEPKIEEGQGFKLGKSNWIYIDENGKGIVTEMFVPGGNYVFTVGVLVEDGYKLPDDLKNIPVTIDFEGGETVALKAKDYREPEKFYDMEVGTYTIHEVKKDDKIVSFDLIFATKPLNAVEDDITFYYHNPVVGDKYTADSEKYFFEANSADGVTVVGTSWEKKIIGSIYKPVKEFEEGSKYRVTLTLYVKAGYELPKNLKSVKITLCDELVKETVLDSKDFKLVPYKIAGIDAGYKLIYELPEKLVKVPDEETTVAPVEPDEPVTKAPEQQEAPNTGAAAASALFVLAFAGAGTAFVTKKRKR